MPPQLALALKVGPWVIILFLAGWIGWLKYDAAKRDLAEAKAVSEFQSRAATLAGDLIIEQAIAMGATEKVVVVNVEKIRNVKVPVDEQQACDICARGERARLGTIGVRDTLYGSSHARP